MPLEYITRHMKDEDKSFIYNSFLQSYHKQYPVKYIPPTIYYKAQSEEIEFLLRKSNVSMAVFPEDADEIMGYAIYEYASDALILHYIYIKNMVRRKYLATNLIKSLLGDNKLIIFTHMFDDFPKVKYKIPQVRMVYDPFFLLNKRLTDAHEYA